VPSRATVGRWVQQAAVQAGRILDRIGKFIFPIPAAPVTQG
jgi:hypothetical protein